MGKKSACNCTFTVNFLQKDYFFFVFFSPFIPYISIILELRLTRRLIVWHEFEWRIRWKLHREKTNFNIRIEKNNKKKGIILKIERDLNEKENRKIELSLYIATCQCMLNPSMHTIFWPLAFLHFDLFIVFPQVKCNIFYEVNSHISHEQTYYIWTLKMDELQFNLQSNQWCFNRN